MSAERMLPPLDPCQGEALPPLKPKGDAARPAAADAHFPCFDGLRAIAATVVFMTHLALAGGANLQNFLGVFWARMDAGVAIFFLISGFLLYRPFVRSRLAERPAPGARPFLWRRVLRIYPAYWLAVVFVVYVFGQAEIPGPVAWIETFSLVHIYDADHYFGPLVQSWTLATEVAFYCFLPVYAFVMRRAPGSDLRTRIRSELFGLGALVVVAWAYRTLVLAGDLGATGQMRMWIFWWLDLFAAGMLLALLSVLVVDHGRKVPVRLDRPAAPAISWLLALASFWVVSTQLDLPLGAIEYTDFQEVGQHLLYGAAAFFLLLPAVFGPQDRGLVRRFLRSRVVVFVGVISYGIYLWHEMWIEEYLGWFDVPFFGAYGGTEPFSIGHNNLFSPNWAFMVAVVGACTVASASASWYLLEKPVLRFKNRVPGGAPLPAPPPAGASAAPLPALGVAEPTPAPATAAEPTAEDPADTPALGDGAPAPDRPADTTPDTGSRRGFWIGLGVITAAAFAWRLVSVLTIATRNPDGGDPLYYHLQANLLADGFGFAEPFTWQATGRIVGSAVHPPLYTMLLSVSSALGGTSFLAHKVVSCAIGAGTVAVIGVLARQFGGLRAGLIAAGIAAAYPNLWVIDGILMPEDLFAFTVGLALVASVCLWRRASWGAAVGFGAAVAAAALTRGEAILLFPLLALPLVLRIPGADLRRRWALLGVIVLSAAVLIAPWTARNLLTFDEPVWLSTNEGDVLAQANCDNTYSTEIDPHAIGFWYYECGLVDVDGDESVASAARREKGLTYIRNHLGDVPRVVAVRLGRIWELYTPVDNAHLSTIEGRNIDVAKAGLYAYYLLMPLAVAGLVVLRRRRTSPLLTLLVPFAMVTITVAMTYSNVRFRAAAEVPIVVLAAITVDAAVRALVARRHRTPPSGAPRAVQVGAS